MSGEVLLTGDDLHDPDLWDDTELIEAYNTAVAQAKGYSGKMQGKWSKKGAEERKKKKKKHEAPRKPEEKRKSKKTNNNKKKPLKVTEQVAPQQYAVPAPLPLPPVPQQQQLMMQPPMMVSGVSLPQSIAGNESLLREVTAWYHAGYQAGLSASREVAARRGY